MTSGRSRRRRTRGSALIEFAIALAIVTPVFVGGWQFFEAYLLVEELQTMATHCAQSAAAIPYDSPDETPSSDFRRAVEDVALQSSIHGLRREHIRVAMHFDGGRPSEVEVKLAGFPVPIPGGAITLDGKPKARYPYRGHWSASAVR